MKRAFLALGILFVLPPSRTEASEAFILNIPIRGIVNQETGMVKAVLGLDTPPAGSTLVVNGATTLNLGDTKPVGGDSVTYEALTGNFVRITYVPKSNFGASRRLRRAWCRSLSALPRPSHPIPTSEAIAIRPSWRG